MTKTCFIISSIGKEGSRIRTVSDEKFDLIFADTWPGKYQNLDELLGLLSIGGLYIIDDMLPQPSWPEGHVKKAADLIDYLDDRTDLHLTKMNWSTGIIVASKNFRENIRSPIDALTRL